VAKPKHIKVCLTNQGDDTETPWAEDLGPAPGGGRKVRLINVPFMHAKPTWGDTVIVTPVDDGFPTWDRGGVPWDKISSRITADGGRWAMIVDYAPHPDAKDAFGAIARACAEHDVVCEGAWGPRQGEPGRCYFAVKNELSDAELMLRLRGAALPCELIQIHPEPQIKPKAKGAAAKAPAKAPPPAPAPVAKQAKKAPPPVVVAPAKKKVVKAPAAAKAASAPKPAAPAPKAKPLVKKARAKK